MPGPYDLSDADQAAMQPETYANPFVARSLAGMGQSMSTPGAVMQPNPYAPGTEEADWYDRQRQTAGLDWAANTALGSLRLNRGIGAPAIERPTPKAPDHLADLQAMLERRASPEEIAQNPIVKQAQDENRNRPHTIDMPGYGTPEFKANREFDFEGEPVKGYDAAIDRLHAGAKAFSTNGPVKAEREATIVLGPPASGKSRLSETFARERNAAIVDSDEAKKVIPEYDNGRGTSAVHEESSHLIFGENGVFDRLLDEGSNMVIPKVGHTPASIQGIMGALKEEGYRVNLVNMNVKADEAYRRMIGRFIKTGRVIGSDYFSGVGDKPTKTYYKLRGEAHESADIDVNGLPGEEHFLDGAETSLAKNIRPGRSRESGDSRNAAPSQGAAGEVARKTGGRVGFADGGTPMSAADDPDFQAWKAANAQPSAPLSAASDPEFQSWKNSQPMEMGDVAGQALANTPSSALQFLKDTVRPIMHPQETLEGVGNFMRGLGEKQKGMYASALGTPQPEGEHEKYANALWDFLKQRYGGVEQAKHSFAQDPVGVLSDASMLLTLGGTSAERLPGIMGKTGEVMSKVGAVTDPLMAPVSAAKAGIKTIGELGTHTGAGALETAYKTGVEGGDAGETFREHMRGNAPMEEPVDIAKQGLENFRSQRAAQYKSAMDKMRMSDAQFAPEDRVLDFGQIDAAVDKALGVQTFKGKVLDPGANAARKDMIDAINDWRDLPPATYHTVEGMDALKRMLGNMMMDTAPGSSARKAATDIYNGVRKTITDYYPKYADTMKEYEKASNLIKEMETSLALKKTSNVDQSLRRLQTIMRNNVNTNYGRRMELGQLLEENGATHLMAALSGQSLNAWFPRGLGKIEAGMIGAGAGIAHSALAGAALPLMSPRLMGEVSHAAGRTIGRGLAYSGDKLGRVGLSNRTVGNLSYRLGRGTDQE